MFPEGVPGVPQGVPPELVQGYQPPPEPVPEPPRWPRKPKPKAKAETQAEAGRGAARPATAAHAAAAAAPQPRPRSRNRPFPDPPPALSADAGLTCHARRKLGIAMAMSFTIAIVGRPNVGKSTLFNRLVGRRLALVDDLPGVTRDRREGQARLGDLDFTIIDTAGLEEADAESLAGRMLAQTKLAIEQADAVFFMIDAQDRAGAGRPRLRRSGAALRQAGDRRRQQGRGQGQRRPGAGSL